MTRGRDPYWIEAKWPGTDAKGAPYKKGERVFYYPNSRKIYAGEAGKEAAADFAACMFDDGGM